jgi:D-alanine-D-alanine ligase-like ATP-grasp enzyme
LDFFISGKYMEHAKRNKCSACGTSNTSHSLLLISDLLEETIGRIGRIFLKIFKIDENHALFKFFEKFFYKISALLGLLKYSDDKDRAVTGRSRLIWDEAERRGIKMQQVFMFGRPVEHYRAFVNGKYINFESIPIPPHMSSSGYGWVDDKFILSERLRTEGIASPSAGSAMLYRTAENIFNRLEKPVILKPRSGSRGRHTTTNINTKEELKKALDLAHAISLAVVVEEHLFGSVYRATTVDGKLVGFFRADPPSVTGDGHSTIEELVKEKNKNKHERMGNIVIDSDALDFLARQTLGIHTVLEDGKKVNLSAKTGRFFGGYTKEMLPEVHPKMHEIFEKAAKIVDIPVAGFDLIIGDPAADPDTQRWGIIECNSMPYIDLHFFALEGKPINIAEYVWDLWKK